MTQRQGVEGQAKQVTDLSEILRQSERDISDYFAEEVFTAETEESQNLLLRVSLLDQIELAACAFATPQEVAQVEQLRRAIELAIRYDYEYWLKREVSRTPHLFSLPEAAELLPQELQVLVKNTVAPQPAPRAGVKLSVSQAVTDLTINLLGAVEIFRDPHRPFAADAWTTRRARDILCFIATRRCEVLP